MEPSVIISAIVALLGAFGGVLIARNKAAETALDCWQALNTEKDEQIERLRIRLESVEVRLAETERKLLLAEQENEELMRKVQRLEEEREQLLTRIDELERKEGCR